MADNSAISIILCEVRENGEAEYYKDGNEIQECLPRHWDEAHGAPPIHPGEYYWACDVNGGESGNAWAWEGPFWTEEHAIEAVKASLTEGGQTCL